jgi:hypothetical protein
MSDGPPEQRPLWRRPAGLLAGFLGLFIAAALCVIILEVAWPGTVREAAAPVVVALPTATPADGEPPLANAQIGEEVSGEHYAVRIDEVSRTGLLRQEERELAPLGHWVIVYGELRNHTESTTTVTSGHFSLATVTPAGDVQPDREATSIAAHQAGIEQSVGGAGGIQLEPGQAHPLVVAFDVPRTATGLAVHLAHGERVVPLGSLDEIPVVPTPVP